MKKLLFITRFTLAFVLLCAQASAQTPAAAPGHYAEDGLSFDYPAGWTITDKSDEAKQHLVITREGSSAIIEIVAQREPYTETDKKAGSKESLWRPFAQEMTLKLGVSKIPAPQQEQCPPFGERPGVGIKLSGSFDGQPSAGEFYTMIVGQRYVNAVFFRTDIESEEAGAAWKAVLETLKADRARDASDAGVKESVLGVVSNGKALSKPPPDYPADAKAARATGPVTVKIVVDETGNVMSAQAVSGHPLLHEAAERAARRAKYSPTTICGRPVKVSGVITYNFVL